MPQITGNLITKLRSSSGCSFQSASVVVVAAVCTHVLEDTIWGLPGVERDAVAVLWIPEIVEITRAARLAVICAEDGHLTDVVSQRVEVIIIQLSIFCKSQIMN